MNLFLLSELNVQVKFKSTETTTYNWIETRTEKTRNLVPNQNRKFEEIRNRAGPGQENFENLGFLMRIGELFLVGGTKSLYQGHRNQDQESPTADNLSDKSSSWDGSFT